MSNHIPGAPGFAGSSAVYQADREELLREIRTLQAQVAQARQAAQVAQAFTSAGSVASANGSLDGHAGRLDNPHATTLEQARQAGADLSGPITWAGDTNLYREAAARLRTDGGLYVGALGVNKAPEAPLDVARNRAQQGAGFRDRRRG